MKHLAKIILILLAFMAAAGSAHADAYTSKSWGFALEIPEDWGMTEFPGQQDGVVVVLQGPDGAALIIRLVPESVDLGDETVRDEALDSFLWALEENGMQDIQIIDEGFADLAEGKGYAMHYQYLLPDGIQVESVSTFVAASDRYFIVTYAAVPPVYERQIKGMADTLKSFRIIPREQKKKIPERGGKFI